MSNHDGLHVLDVQRGHRKLLVTVEIDQANLREEPANLAAC